MNFEPLEALPGPQYYSYADTQFEIIKRYIEEFQASLDKEQDVAVMLTNFGQSVQMTVTEITYEKSVLMVFRGFVDGEKATLIQHISQLNFLLKAVPKDPSAQYGKIGFRLDP